MVKKEKTLINDHNDITLVSGGQHGQIIFQYIWPKKYGYKYEIHFTTKIH